MSFALPEALREYVDLQVRSGRFRAPMLQGHPADTRGAAPLVTCEEPSETQNPRTNFS